MIKLSLFLLNLVLVGHSSFLRSDSILPVDFSNNDLDNPLEDLNTRQRTSVYESYKTAPSGSFYELSTADHFNIEEDVLGKSMHIDSSEFKSSKDLKNEGAGLVLVPSSYGEGFQGSKDRLDDLDEEDVAEIDDSELKTQPKEEFDQSEHSQQYPTGLFRNHSNDYHQILAENPMHFLESPHPSLIDKEAIENLPPPLILTPYINTGNYKMAQELSAVIPFIGNIRSYSGYFTVDKHFQSNMFFWFFPCEREDYRDRPVLLWLQGGPGASSLFGLFYEHGPYKIVDNRLYENEHTWSKHYNVLYIDNPVGTGFSFTNPDGYTKNQTIIGKHLYEGLKQFFHMFPDLADNDFYITGESYAGKYIPAAAFEIHQQNHLSHFKINLKGLFIGNGLIDPVSMMEYSDYLYNLGLLDEIQRDLFAKEEDKIRLLIWTKQFKKASEAFENLFFSSRVNKTEVNFRKMTGFKQHYNLNGLDYTTKNFNHFLQDIKVRERLHVGRIKYSSGDKVEKALLADVMKSVIDKVNVLIENYRIVFFYGQLDIICPYRLSEAFFRKIQYRYAPEYHKAKRQIWRYERNDGQDNVVGYIKEAHNLVEILIRNAGHMVPRDQPSFTIEMLRKYIGS